MGLADSGVFAAFDAWFDRLLLLAWEVFIRCEKEVPGFVANGLQCALVMEHFSLVTRVIVTPEE